MSAPPPPAGAQRQRAPPAQSQPSQQQQPRRATTPTNTGAAGDTSHMQPITLPATVVPPAGPSSVQPPPVRQALRPPQPVIAPPMGQDDEKMYDDEKVVMGELVNEQYNQCMDSFQNMIRQLGNDFGLRLAVFCANDQECWYLTENPQAQMFADAHLKKFGKLMGVTPKNPSSSRKRKRPPEPEDYIRERDIVRKKLLDMSGGVRTLPGNSAKIEGNILKGKRATFLLQNWPLKEWINPSYLNAMQCGQILAAIESPTHPLKFRRVVPNPAAQGGLQVAPGPGPKHLVEDMPDDWVPVPITAQPAQPQVPGISAFIPFAQLSQFRSAMPIQLAGSQQPVSPQVPPGPPPAGPGQPQGQQSPQPQLLHAPPGPPPHAGPQPLNQPPLPMPSGPQGQGQVQPPQQQSPPSQPQQPPSGGAGANAAAGRGQPRRPPNNK